MAKRGLTIRWDPDLRDKIQEMADSNHRSFAQEVAYLVSKGMEMEEIREAGAAENVIRHYSALTGNKKDSAM